MHLDCSCLSTGAGDILAALWAVFAAKKAGATVRFHVPDGMPRTVARMFLEEAELGPPIRQRVEFFNPWKPAHLATLTMARTRFYWSKLPAELQGDGPERPRILNATADEEFEGKILLFPVSNYLERVWPAHHWRAMADKLVAQGYDPVFMLDGGRMAQTLKTLTPAVSLPDWPAVARAMLGAKFTVCLDSGPLHLAGALAVPGVAVFAQMKRVFCADYASILPVVPEWPGTCAGCNFLPAQGYHGPGCRGHCHELWSISPQAVAWQVCQTIGKPC